MFSPRPAIANKIKRNKNNEGNEKGKGNEVIMKVNTRTGKRTMKIYKEQAGVISDEPIWVCWHSCYLYGYPTLIGLIIKMIKEWNDESNMIG